MRHFRLACLLTHHFRPLLAVHRVRLKQLPFPFPYFLSLPPPPCSSVPLSAGPKRGLDSLTGLREKPLGAARPAAGVAGAQVCSIVGCSRAVSGGDSWVPSSRPVASHRRLRPALSSQVLPPQLPSPLFPGDVQLRLLLAIDALS